MNRDVLCREIVAALDVPHNGDLIFIPNEKIEDFEKAIDVICQNKLQQDQRLVYLEQGIIKKLLKIRSLDQSALCQRASDAISVASQDYRDNKKSDSRVRGAGETFLNNMAPLDIFGFHSRARKETLKKRMDTVESTNQTHLEKLLSLLGDGAEGDKKLDSFKYFLASCFLQVEASSNEAATMLVDIARNELYAILHPFNPLEDDRQEDDWVMVPGKFGSNPKS